MRYLAVRHNLFFKFKFKNVSPFVTLVASPPLAQHTQTFPSHLQGDAAAQGPTAGVVGWRNQTHQHTKPLSTGQQQAASQNLNPTHIKGKQVFQPP